MSKPNSIRKKALDYAKKRQWDKALVEFSRLVEIEQHNPNLFNEIGDIQLKLGNKREAFKRYHEAIDAYAKVGLHNNSVAVCKKILRLNPVDVIVYGKMATLRKRQGFDREAVEYSVTFLDKVGQEPDAGGDQTRTLVLELADIFDSEPEVLERAIECLLKDGQNAEAGPLLEKLGTLYAARGMTAGVKSAKEKMASIGYAPEALADDGAREKLQTVETHRENRPAYEDVPFNGSVPPHIRRGREGDASDFGTIEMGASKVAGAEGPAGNRQPANQDSNGSRPPAHSIRGAREFDADPTAVENERLLSRDQRGTDSAAVTAAASAAEEAVAGPAEEPAEEQEKGPKEYVIPAEPDEAAFSQSAAEVARAESGVGEEREEAVLAVTGEFTATLAAEVRADVDEGDHRSHYDLGMAYLEMGLHADAIREFQAAADSPVYQVRSLEMIGSCLIGQGQPKLAVKQLTKGLSLAGDDDRATLGLKYNLALAYEMIGDDEKAKPLFEDVYVVDITFRDIQDKMKKYSS